MLGGYMKIRHHVYSTVLVPVTYTILPLFTLDLWLGCSPYPHLLFLKASKKVLINDGNGYVGYIIV